MSLMDRIPFVGVSADVMLSALGLKAASRIHDDESFELGVCRKPDSASFIVVMTRRRWGFFGPRSMSCTIRLADKKDVAWALSELDRRAPLRVELASYTMSLWTPTHELARGLVARGYELGTLSTVGRVSTALSRIAARGGVESEVGLRDAGPGDAEAIGRISEALEREGLEIPRGFRLPTAAVLHEELRRGTRCGTVAVVEGEVVGSMTASFFSGDDCALCGLEVLVLPKHQRRGVARALYRHILERIKALNPEALVYGVVAHTATQRLSASLGRVPFQVQAYEGATASAAITAALELHEAESP